MQRTGSNGGHRCQAGCRHDGQSAGCWGARHFSKTAWVIVDALRLDFVACEGAQAAGAACRSRMPHLLDLAQSSVSPVSRSLQSIVRTSATAQLQTKASNSVRRGPAAQMYKFVADPPTTTMQRLRGHPDGAMTAWRSRLHMLLLPTPGAMQRAEDAAALGRVACQHLLTWVPAFLQRLWLRTT